jgi:hypothetical protein
VAPGPTSEEAANPWWGQHLFSHAAFWNFASWYCEAGVRFYQWTRGDLRLARDAAEVVGVEAIMTSFPEPPQRCILPYGVEPFHTIPPGLHLSGSCWLTSGAWALLSASG